MTPNPEALVMKALAQALAPLMAQEKHTTPSGTPSTPYYFGPGGLFGVVGLERDIISTRVQPQGLASILPSRPSTDMYPQFAYLTGYRDDSGSEPATVCADAPVAGPAKSCIQTAQFGRYTRMTRELEINRVGQTINRGELMDYRFMNDPLVNDFAGIFSQRFALGNQEAIWSGAEMIARFVEVGVAFQNLLCPQTYIGNPANNNAGGGYKEFPGLDILVGTNKYDALTNTECPSLDSDVKNFNYGLVTNVDLDPDIVTVITYMFRYLEHNASRMNFGNTTWKIVMRDDLFYELTSVWPCRYLTYRCWAQDSSHIDPVMGGDVREAVAMRDAMRNGKYLLIDGRQIPVVIDDCIAEESTADTNKLPAGRFASDIYILPFTVRGGREVLYWEYFDYSKSIATAQQGQLSEFFWSDGGRFLWHAKPPTNWCIQHIAKIEPRLILLTPQLAGRITNVAYAPLQHTRDPLPDQDYFVNGGVYTPRATPSLYSDWNPAR